MEYIDSMKITKNTPVKLKTFLGKTSSKEDKNTTNDYWKLIGLNGIVVDEDGGGKVLVKFEKDLDNYNVANHNSIKNTLWINKYDLEINKMEEFSIRLNKEILKRTGLMNNKKWNRLFSNIDREIDCNNVFIKFLLMENEINNLSDLTGKISKNGIGDIVPTGPFKYKEIEYIIIKNNAEKIIEIIKSIGKIEYEIVNTEIKIYGYR